MVDINKIATEDLMAFQVKDLLALQARLTFAIDQRKDQDKVDLAKKIRALASENGFELEDLLQVKIKVKKERKPRQDSGKAVAAKYVSDTNPNDTWTGRGKAPKWLQQKEADGRKREEFLVQ